MEMIQGAEWVVVAIFATASLAGLFLVVSAQGDMRLREEAGENDDDQAAAMLIDLVHKARSSLVIHDDGNDSAESVYNNDGVVAAIRDRIKQRRRLEVMCLFNDREKLKLLELADGECRNNISIWYAGGDRPENDIHYKIVDGGRLVHLSAHAHGASERGYVLRKAEPWWAARTRRRISRPYLEHFEHSLPAAERRA